MAKEGVTWDVLQIDQSLGDAENVQISENGQERTWVGSLYGKGGDRDLTPVKRGKSGLNGSPDRYRIGLPFSRSQKAPVTRSRRAPSVRGQSEMEGETLLTRSDQRLRVASLSLHLSGTRRMTAPC